MTNHEHGSHREQHMPPEFREVGQSFDELYEAIYSLVPKGREGKTQGIPEVLSRPSIEERFQIPAFRALLLPEESREAFLRDEENLPNGLTRLTIRSSEGVSISLRSEVDNSYVSYNLSTSGSPSAEERVRVEYGRGSSDTLLERPDMVIDITLGQVNQSVYGIDLINVTSQDTLTAHASFTPDSKPTVIVSRETTGG